MIQPDNHQDWTEVKWDKRGTRQINETKAGFIKRETLSGRSSGAVASFDKINKAGSNGLNDKVMSTRKLEDEVETFKHKTLSASIAKRIAQKRCELKISQKELANKIFVPENIIKEYERIGSKVIPNPNILNKIEKVIGRVRD